MKTLNKKINNLILVFGIAMGILIITTTMAEAGNPENDKKSLSEEQVNTKVIKAMEAEDSFENTFMDMYQRTLFTGTKVYDRNDQLVFTTPLTPDQAAKDPLFYALIKQGELIMESNGISYYQLHQ